MQIRQASLTTGVLPGVVDWTTSSTNHLLDRTWTRSPTSGRHSDGDRFSPKAFKLSVLLRARRLGTTGQPFARTGHGQCRRQEFVPPRRRQEARRSRVVCRSGPPRPIQNSCYASRARMSCLHPRFPWSVDARRSARRACPIMRISGHAASNAARHKADRRRCMNLNMTRPMAKQETVGGSGRRLVSSSPARPLDGDTRGTGRIGGGVGLGVTPESKAAEGSRSRGQPARQRQIRHKIPTSIWSGPPPALLQIIAGLGGKCEALVD